MRRILLWSFLLVSTACSGTEWTARPDTYRNAAILVETVPSDAIRFEGTYPHAEVAASFAGTAVDSLFRLTVRRLVEAPVYASQGVRLADSYRDSDFVLKVVSMRVRNHLSFNFVRPGPIIGVELVVDAYRGDTRIFRDTRTGYGNMAFLARTEPGVHWLSPEAKADPELQRRALESAYRQALGASVSAFMQLNR